MSSFPPPNTYFNGIIYDSSFFNVISSSGLTLSQANAKFLQKTVADIDPFLATFQSGIKTNDINTADPTGATNCGIFEDATDCIIDIGPTTQPPGHSALIRLGLANSTVQCGSGTGKFICQKLESFSGDTKSLYNDLLWV